MLSSRDTKKAKEAIELLTSLVHTNSEPGPSSAQSTPNVNSTANAENDGSSERSQALLKAADRAMSALQGMRTGIRGECNVGKKRRLKTELTSKLLSKKSKKIAWKHRFFCLSMKDEEKVPTTEVQKDDLYRAGLGEKVVEFFSLDISADEFKEVLYEAYPTLEEAGGFELCRCLPNSRQLEPLSAIAHSSLSLLKERVGNSRTYIRPLQKDIEIKEIVSIPAGPKEACLKCGLRFSLTHLKTHVELCCSPVNSSDFPPAFPENEYPARGRLGSDDQGTAASMLRDVAHDNDVLNNEAWEPTASTVTADDDEIEDVLIHAALQQSVADQVYGRDSEPVSESNKSNLGCKIRSLRRNIMDPDSPALRLDIRRQFVVQDAIREARKKKFDCMKRLQITFVGEGAIDQGGPRREFFRLLALNASEYYFEGSNNHKFFRNSVQLLQSREFFFLGQLIGMSIIQGGSGLPILANAVYSYLSTGSCTNAEVDVDSVPEGKLKFAVDKIRWSEDDNQLQATLFVDEIMSLILQTGYSKPLTQVVCADKEELQSVLTDFHLLVKVKLSMDQFLDGLRTVGITYCF